MNHTSNEGVTLSTDQQTVFNWINDELQLPVFAEAYKGALNLLEKKLPGYITFVSHTGRDLMNSLPRLGIQPESVQYVQLVGEIQNHWEDEWGVEVVSNIDNTEIGNLIPYEICEKIQVLINKHRDGRHRASKAESLFFTTFLDYADADEIPLNLLTEWKRARRWFLEHTHLRDGEFDMAASSEVVRHFQNLDDFLYTAASSELERIRSMDEILEETNE
ncbi:MAG: hypothetical protein OXP71_16380 [Candidatus Poribacteria bacterium]|nr:hypothetical protein [Candidatus Poribacteria bacterium]